VDTVQSIPVDSTPTPPVMEIPEIVEQPVVETPAPVMDTPTVTQPEVDTQSIQGTVPSPAPVETTQMPQDVTVDDSLSNVTPPPIEEPTLGESVAQESFASQGTTNIQSESMDLIPPQPVNTQVSDTAPVTQGADIVNTLEEVNKEGKSGTIIVIGLVVIIVILLITIGYFAFKIFF
jgi:hypothetical protein